MKLVNGGTNKTVEEVLAPVMRDKSKIRSVAVVWETDDGLMRVSYYSKRMYELVGMVDALKHLMLGNLME